MTLNETSDSQLFINENRSLCKLRHKNGNCLCVGGFCTAVNDEICRSIRMSYEKGYVDGKTNVAEEKHGQWLAYEFGDKHWHKCSVCGKADEYINNLGLVAVRNYCPNCGAKMEMNNI